MPEYLVTQYGRCSRSQVIEAEDASAARDAASEIGEWEYDFEVLDDDVSRA